MNKYHRLSLLEREEINRRLAQNEKLRLHWSPEQIANQLKTEHTDDMVKQVSHETIYTYIYVLPKGTDFNNIPREEIKHVQNLLNGRPRKVLNWRKPEEVFSELVALAT